MTGSGGDFVRKVAAEAALEAMNRLKTLTGGATRGTWFMGKVNNDRTKIIHPNGTQYTLTFGGQIGEYTTAIILDGKTAYAPGAAPISTAMLDGGLDVYLVFQDNSNRNILVTKNLGDTQYLVDLSDLALPSTAVITAMFSPDGKNLAIGIYETTPPASNPIVNMEFIWRIFPNFTLDNETNKVTSDSTIDGNTTILCDDLLPPDTPIANVPQPPYPPAPLIFGPSVIFLGHDVNKLAVEWFLSNSSVLDVVGSLTWKSLTESIWQITGPAPSVPAGFQGSWNGAQGKEVGGRFSISDISGAAIINSVRDYIVTSLIDWTDYSVGPSTLPGTPYYRLIDTYDIGGIRYTILSTTDIATAFLGDTLTDIPTIAAFSPFTPNYVSQSAAYYRSAVPLTAPILQGTLTPIAFSDTEWIDTSNNPFDSTTIYGNPATVAKSIASEKFLNFAFDTIPKAHVARYSLNTDTSLIIKGSSKSTTFDDSLYFLMDYTIR